MVNWEGWKIESEHDMQYIAINDEEDGEKPEFMTIYMQNVAERTILCGGKFLHVEG